MSGTLEDIQDDLIERLHAGEAIDQEEVLRLHPQHQAALRGFFALLAEIERAPAADGAQPALLGEFTIVREIGRGGMGVVYEAEQASLRRRVALKVLPPALGRNEQVVARFRREAEAAGRLRHPNIVPVFSVGEAAGTPFFAMELVEGRSLAEVLAARRDGDDAGLPAAGAPWRTWAVETAATIADALAYAHEKGILHRDIKPGNVILDDKGAPRLTDFGLALDMHAGGLTVSGENLGTPQYMSPEQLAHRAKAVDARADVYSLGVTLYELLTLRLPYEAESTAELFAALQGGRIVPPRKLVPELDRDLEAVLLRALQVDPEDRYRSAAAFAADLRAVLGDEPIAPAPRRRRRRALSRRATLVAAGAGLLVVVAGALAIATHELGPTMVTPPATPTAADWARLATGKMGPNSEDTLRRWLRIELDGRPYRRLADQRGEVPLRVSRLLVPGGAPDAEPVVLLVRREREAGERWLDVQQAWMQVTDPDAYLRKGPSRGSWRMFSGAEKPGDELRVRYRVQLRLMVRPAGWGAGERMMDHWDDVGGVRAAWEGEHVEQFVDEYPADYPKPLTSPEADSEARTLIASTSPRLLRTILQFEVPPGGLARTLGGHLEVLAPDGRRLGRSTLWQLGERPPKNRPLRIGLIEADGKAIEQLETVRVRFTGKREFAIRMGLHEYWAGSLEIDVPVGHPE